NHRSYHNPDVSVLERLTKINAEIYATYISGDIIITFSGEGVNLSPPENELVTTSNFADAA
ncbi:MAG: hypothetical protein LBU41_00045, partial [Clostridiales Family XIII bacterium]|nr:hypothetical protein [Clostridiales Family XIII bacterium]